MARVLTDLVILLACQGYRHLPRFAVDLGIVDGAAIIDGVRVNGFEAVVDVRPSALRDTFDACARCTGGNPSFAVGIGGVDDQRVALRVAERIAVPLAN